MTTVRERWSRCRGGKLIRPKESTACNSCSLEGHHHNTRKWCPQLKATDESRSLSDFVTSFESGDLSHTANLWSCVNDIWLFTHKQQHVQYVEVQWMNARSAALSLYDLSVVSNLVIAYGTKQSGVMTSNCLCRTTIEIYINQNDVTFTTKALNKWSRAQFSGVLFCKTGRLSISFTICNVRKNIYTTECPWIRSLILRLHVLGNQKIMQLFDTLR